MKELELQRDRDLTRENRLERVVSLSVLGIVGPAAARGRSRTHERRVLLDHIVGLILDGDGRSGLHIGSRRHCLQVRTDDSKQLLRGIAAEIERHLIGNQNIILARTQAHELSA